MDYEYIECDFSYSDRVVKFILDDGVVFVNVYFPPFRGFWWRLKTAIKYIFGCETRCGSEMMLANEEVGKLTDLCLAHSKNWNGQVRIDRMNVIKSIEVRNKINNLLEELFNMTTENSNETEE